MSEKFVYLFAEGNETMRELLGGKGANLAEMSRLGMPVPYGFTITTEACNQYYADGECINADIRAQIEEYLAKLEEQAEKKFGDVNDPLLVSVRSGARASMPGMMDTILNLGMNDEVVAGVEKLTGNARFAYDSYRRFIQMYADVVMGLSKARFEEIIDEVKKEKGISDDLDLDAEDMKTLVQRFKAFYEEELKEPFPSDPRVQLFGAIEAVFRSWNNPRAIYYRKMNDIPGSWGTAVNVQMMVFGNMGNDCGTGVAFTRNPATGENKLYGEFLMNALQIACDMVDEGKVTVDEALMMVEPKQLDALLHPMFDAAELKAAVPIASALPASPGAACGQIVFTAEEAIEEAGKGKKVVLVRLETSPEDIEGMHVAQGILTVRGGMTSHAAVVARGMGACCVSGCGDIDMHEEEGYFTVNGKDYHRGEWISLDGSTGHIYGQAIKTVPAAISGNFERFMKWADERRQLKIRTNADTPRDAAQAVRFGAEGIGLVRTEHMFFDGDRIKAVREMIVSKTVEQRKRALEKLLPMQRGDFEGIYEAMEGMPVTIRYLDPPLHEFLPTNDADIVDLAEEMGMAADELRSIVVSLHEFNPMMGHRGCRLAVSYPEIAEMQTTAVIEAAINVQKRHPEWTIEPEIMIPLVGDQAELRFVKKIVTETADRIIADSGRSMTYKVGTMIEIPRAALLADEIAQEAEFFSFGTNDLTQMTFGFSRDDAGGFLSDYYEKKIFESDPFAHLDQKGVGKLIEMAAAAGRKTRPDIKLGICGEHGGDPASIEFCHRVGLNYVSCSPYRVPIARLAAAQAAIKNKQ